MYARFDKELYRSGSFTCRRDDEESGLFTAVLVSLPGYTDLGKTVFSVTRLPDADMYRCDCKKFEHGDMPCRHIICVRFIPHAKPYLNCFSQILTSSFLKTVPLLMRSFYLSAGLS
jgi:hypothetical protein